AKSIAAFPLMRSGSHGCDSLHCFPSDSSGPAKQRTLIGVGVLICRTRTSDGVVEVLIGKRKGSHGAGCYSLPGGHLEADEDFSNCAAREAEEETALKLKPARVVYLTNNAFPTFGRQYITVFVQSEPVDGKAEPQNLEAEKCEGWIWAPW